MEEFPGFTLTQTDGIHVYHVTDITRAAVDAWYVVDKQQSIDAANTTRHVRRLWVLEKVIYPTPYFISVAQKAIDETPPNLYESTAVVVAGSIAYNMMSLVFNRSLKMRQQTAFRIFHQEAAAIAWLNDRRQVVDTLLSAS